MDYQIEVLQADKDQDAWLDIISWLEPRYQDVFLLPGYGRVFEEVFQAPCGLFCLRQGDNIAFNIYLRRPIHKLPFFASLNKAAELYDIISPEYSGPLIQCRQEDRPEFTKLFWQEFHSFCLKEKIVAEFGRLNPYYNNESDFLSFISASANRKIVYIDLTLSEKEIWRGFSKGNKSSIKKAGREKVIIKQAEPEKNLDEFYRLYHSTMQRNQAEAFYYFSLDFFHSLFYYLKDNTSLFFAYYGNQIIAASIFLHLNQYIHYYFSGSDQAFLNLCPNNLLIYEVMRWAKEKGFKVFNLGGGYHYDGKDSLFGFKSSFSASQLDFYTYQRIHSEKLYQELCAKYIEFNRLNPQDLDQVSFFPLYRTRLRKKEGLPE